MRPANERRRYIVTTSLIGWAHTGTDTWIMKDTRPELGWFIINFPGYDDNTPWLTPKYLITCVVPHYPYITLRLTWLSLVKVMACFALSEPMKMCCQIWLPGANFSEIRIEIRRISVNDMHLNLSFAKWRPFCLGLSVIYADYVNRWDMN